jgi:multicomponent K+:H+ antiporter subunit E
LRRLLPYPLLALALVVMWLLLSGYSRGQLILAVFFSIAAVHAFSALGEASPRVRRWLAIPELLGVVLWDILLSNIAVARIILARPARRSGFITVPLRIRHPSALGILSVIITATPGTAWFDYSTARNEVLVHVFDLDDEQHWKDLIANRYERRLLEIFR